MAKLAYIYTNNMRFFFPSVFFKTRNKFMRLQSVSLDEDTEWIHNGEWANALRHVDRIGYQHAEE